MNDEDQTIKTQLDSAPQEIRELLASGVWEKSVTNIAKANHLSEDQATELQNEVLFVLLGMDLASNFAKNVQDNVKVPSLLSGGIALDIDHEIFAQVKDLLPTEIEPETPLTAVPNDARESKTLSEEILGAAVHKEVVTKADLQTPELEMAHDEIATTQPTYTPSPPETPIPKPVEPTQTIPQNTVLEQKVAENLALENTPNKILVDQYKGNDPYREPI